MIIVVDFDGTLALNNPSHITLAEPNYELIERLKSLKSTINPYIKIVTARGAKGGLTEQQKRDKYQSLIEEFLKTYSVPYDEISFTKEYGDLYIDDMTISQNAPFSSFKSPFTDNDLIFTEHSVIKKSKSSLFERNWYTIAKEKGYNVPDVLFLNDETIITERINNFRKPSVGEVIELIKDFRSKEIRNYPFETYKDRLVQDPLLSEKALSCISSIEHHQPSFFHGDLSTTNILVNDRLWLIDPNYKMVFGSWLTDAGKALFSFIAYEDDHRALSTFISNFGQEVVKYAVCEGVRVAKHKPAYYKYVNLIADGL